MTTVGYRVRAEPEWRRRAIGAVIVDFPDGNDKEVPSTYWLVVASDGVRNLEAPMQPHDSQHMAMVRVLDDLGCELLRSLQNEGYDSEKPIANDQTSHDPGGCCRAGQSYCDNVTMGRGLEACAKCDAPTEPGSWTVRHCTRCGGVQFSRLCTNSRATTNKVG